MTRTKTKTKTRRTKIGPIGRARTGRRLAARVKISQARLAPRSKHIATQVPFLGRRLTPTKLAEAARASSSKLERAPAAQRPALARRPAIAWPNVAAQIAHQSNGTRRSSQCVKADKCNKRENGIEKVLELVGMPLPDMYSPELWLFVLEAGIKLLETEKPLITYLSLTDYIQHRYAPGEPARC